ncbi:L,D-transpeptidase Cds6 family protein [Rhodoferax antarcticus]|uniref:L,D-transpeptidase Cds6 family protein n=1 Tax=Rhodoferax antarcticus TaxID=81479 RepID=UPI0022256701|nr:tetratricopeptide repeat protein [Rhodoferax antarcticus]MCW2311491.1 tetratricopeptide (TPR) repeat protein [Rhodoferax antarcticus]
MKQAPNALYKSLRLLVLASACLTATVYADEYADVSQLMRANKFSEAMTRVDSHLAAKPGDPQMRFFKGVIQRSQGKPTEAIATFTELTQDYPELPEPYNNLAVLYAGQGLYDKARSALEMAIRTNPSYATAHENLGDVYARLASQAYNKALQLDSGNTAVSPKLAVIGEVFAPNLGKPRPPASPPVVTEAVIPAAKPAPMARATAMAKPAAPAAAVATATPIATTSSATPVATSSTEPTSVPLDAEANKAVEAAVLAWTKAWSAKNMDAYLKAYSPDFDPAGKQSLSAWKKERYDRIVGRKSISVKVTNLNIRVRGDEAVASFRQAYKAERLSVFSQKTLDLKKSGQNWLITRESTGR